MSLSPIAQLYYGQPHRLMFRAGTYLALLRTFAQGHLVGHFHDDSDLAHHTLRRLHRTRDALRVLILSGCGSAEGQRTLARLKEVHAGLQASPMDFLHVLGLFITEPVRWNHDLGRPPMTLEQQAHLLAFWHEVGLGMGLKDMPTTLAGWQALCAAHEARHWQATPQGHDLARACLQDVVRLSVPWWGRGAFRQLMTATADPHMLAVLGLPAPGRLARAAWRALARLA